jgi:hypothetical protein
LFTKEQSVQGVTQPEPKGDPAACPKNSFHQKHKYLTIVNRFIWAVEVVEPHQVENRADAKAMADAALAAVTGLMCTTG